VGRGRELRKRRAGHGVGKKEEGVGVEGWEEGGLGRGIGEIRAG
jgi:hypothetical protein